MERWEKGFDIVTDRMEKIRFYVSAIQKNYRFNLLNMEELWNLYKSFLTKNLSEIGKKKQPTELEILLY